MPQIPENTPLPLPNFSHSEEVDELLGKPPAWLLRSGIGVIFTVLLSFFIASWFIKYPEVVSSQVVFTTLNPPVSLIARSSGKIQELFVKANDSVKAYEVIAIIENTTNYKALTTLESKLGKEDFSNEKLNIDFSLLGELQTPYENYCKALKDYQLFKELDYNNLKIKALEQQIVFQKQLGNNLGEQSGLQKEDLQLYKRQFEADSLLRKHGAVVVLCIE